MIREVIFLNAIDKSWEKSRKTWNEIVYKMYYGKPNSDQICFSNEMIYCCFKIRNNIIATRFYCDKRSEIMIAVKHFRTRNNFKLFE